MKSAQCRVLAKAPGERTLESWISEVAVEQLQQEDER